MYTSHNNAVIVRGARFMPCTLIDENSGKTYEINVKEPKLKVYKMFEKLNDESSVDEIIDAAAAILNSNKENIRITSEFVEENLSLDEVAQLFDDFTSWIKSARTNNPN